MKQNWIRKVIGGLSLTSALFVFQACYGTPQDLGWDLLLEGQVKSKDTGLPIPGIKISVDETKQYETSDEDGKFSFYTEMLENLTLHFEDTDSTLNDYFESKDTLLIAPGEHVYLDINLESK